MVQRAQTTNSSASEGSSGLGQEVTWFWSHLVPPSPGYLGQATHVSGVVVPLPLMGGLGQMFPMDSSQTYHSKITGFKESLATKH